MVVLARGEQVEHTFIYRNTIAIRVFMQYMVG